MKAKFAAPMIEPEPTKVASMVPPMTGAGKDRPASTKSSPELVALARPNQAPTAIISAM